MNAAYVLGDSRYQSHWARSASVGVFFLGAGFGGAFTGGMVGLVSVLLAPIPFLNLAVGMTIAIGALTIHIVCGTSALPQAHRQIPESVFYEGRYLGWLQFGMAYGSGVRTYLSSSAPYIALGGGLILEPPFSFWLILGAVFGTSKSLAAVLRTMIYPGRPAAGLGSQIRLIEWLPVPIALAFVAMAILAIDTA
jgi:hypothetical protein